MIQKEELVKKVNKIEDRLFVSKVIDKAIRGQRKNELTYSDFIDPYQKKLIERVFSGIKELNYIFFGGIVGAERTVVVFCPDYISPDDFLDNQDVLKVLSVEYISKSCLSHRDFLGALVSLGIKREKIGDILVEEGLCKILVFNEIAEYIKYNLKRIGNTNVKVEIEDLSNLDAPDKNLKEINATVASLRIDCIASLGYGISRSKVVELIKGQKLNLNWQPTSDVAKQVKEGDVISIRGKGRISVEKINGLTKKGRTGVKLNKYI